MKIRFPYLLAALLWASPSSPRSGGVAFSIKAQDGEVLVVEPYLPVRVGIIQTKGLKAQIGQSIHGCHQSWKEVKSLQVAGKPETITRLYLECEDKKQFVVQGIAFDE